MRSSSTVETLATGGVRRDGAIIACETEAEVYAALNLPFIPPELRETGEEVAWAEAGDLPELVSTE